MKSRKNVTRRARMGRYWLAAAALAASAGAQAISFQMFDGSVEGQFDTTLGYGMQLRTEKYDPNLSRPWPYTGTDLNNIQYGNRRLFDNKWDVFSNLVKASHDLQLNGDGWSVFVQGNYFYDFKMAQKKGQLPDAAENRAINHGDITAAYFLTRLGSADQFTLRVGKQVISWGENTFIGGSLNDINTVDISKLRQPGVELKDALVGTPAIDLSWQINSAITAEAFVLLGYSELKADPYGGFFGTNDAIVDGGGFANGGSPAFPRCIAPDLGSCGLGPLTRSQDHLPGGVGQYGLALRYYAPNLGNGFDFGLYYENLHDHNPMLSAIAGNAVFAGPPSPATLRSGQVGTFFIDTAKNVDRFGASFNTTVGPWALGGEYSYRRNAPIQGSQFVNVALTGKTAGPFSRTFAPGSVFEGFERYHRHQIQLTTQRLWGPMPMLLGADQWNTIGEVAYGWVGDLPGRDINGHKKHVDPTTYVPGSDFVRFDDVTNNFWGFVARSSLTYNNILFNRINMNFDTSLRWDVDGVSPELGGAELFVAGRKQASVGFVFDYALRWKVGITQTFIFGGENQYRTGQGRGANVNNTDRDFLSLDVSYTF